MDCLRFDQLVQRYLDRDLGPMHRELMEEHAARCSGCAGILAAYVSLFETLGSLDREPAPPSFAASVLARLDVRAHCPTLGERFFRFLRQPEDVLPGPAQVGVALTILVGLLASARAWYHGLEAHLLESLGEAATWTYGSVSSGVAGTWARFLGAEWPVIRQTISTLVNAARLCLDLHRGALGLTALAAAALVALAASLYWARGARGGPHAPVHLV